MSRSDLYPLGRITHNILYYSIGCVLFLSALGLTLVSFIGFLFLMAWLDHDEPLKSICGMAGMIGLIGGITFSWPLAWSVTPDLIFKIEKHWGANRV